MSYSMLYIDDAHIEARQNFVFCIDALDKILGEDLANIILSYHYYNDYIDNIKIYIPNNDYKILLKFANYHRQYIKHKKILLNILTDNIVDNILSFYEYFSCLTYEYRITGCYQCNCISI